MSDEKIYSPQIPNAKKQLQNFGYLTLFNTTLLVGVLGFGAGYWLAGGRIEARLCGFKPIITFIGCDSEWVQAIKDAEAVINDTYSDKTAKDEAIDALSAAFEIYLSKHSCENTDKATCKYDALIKQLS